MCDPAGGLFYSRGLLISYTMIDWDGFFNNGGYSGHLDPEGYAEYPYDDSEEVDEFTYDLLYDECEDYVEE